MDSQILLIIILIIISVDFALEQFLDYLNLKNQKEELPNELKDIYDEEKYKKSISYSKANTRFSFLTSTLSFVLFFLLLSTGAFGYLDQWLRQFVDNQVFLALAFFGIIYIASDLLSLPFQVYGTFVIEEKFGFNKTTAKTFITDKLKGYVLGALIGGLIVGILLYLILFIGENFWIYFWLVIAAFILLVNMFYTSWIIPLFNKLTPLDDGALKQTIENYSAKVNFPLENVFVIDGSKRSSKANAFFSGIGKKKKIVLYDTLINNHTNEELVAVLAHEVGHFKKKHIITGYLLSILQVGIMLFIMSLLIYSPAISQALGAEQLSIPINLMAFGILYTPISKVTGLLMNVISRKNEYEADEFAATTYNGEALQEALKKLSVNNLSNLLPHKWYVFFHYSHPPLLKRLHALNEADKHPSPVRKAEPY